MKNNDYLFSRKRLKIKFNFLKKLLIFRNKTKIEIILFIILFFILMILILFIRFAYPIFKSSCENAASSKGTIIINEEVRYGMKNYNYNSLINMQKDNNGNVSFIEANTNLINDLVSVIINNIQARFNQMERVNVYINMGTVSGISILNNLNPNFEITLESAGKIKSSIKSEFESVGINQTHHRIYLDIESRVSILTPINTFYRDIKQSVILTESIIVGNVPETYYNLEDMTSPEDTYNFME